MKKSLRLLVATAVMAAALTFAATANPNSVFAFNGMQPQCPPGGCALNQ